MMTVIPIVFDALEPVSKCLEKRLEELEIKRRINHQYFQDRLEYSEKSRRQGETCYHSHSS